jgi:hypothetical protein
MPEAQDEDTKIGHHLWNKRERRSKKRRAGEFAGGEASSEGLVSLLPAPDGLIFACAYSN